MFQFPAYLSYVCDAAIVVNYFRLGFENEKVNQLDVSKYSFILVLLAGI